MKNIKTFALFSVIVLFFVSCGNSNKKPSTEWADSYCENLILRMDLCKNVYETYVNIIPTEAMYVGSVGVDATYEVMIPTFKEQKDLLDKTAVFEGAEEDVQLTQKMKDLAGNVIDIYIDGGQKELLNIKKLVHKGQTLDSEEIDAELTSFETRLNAAYEAFGKEQEVYAKKYGIILY